MKIFFTRTVALFLILAILAPFALQPKKAEAQWSVLMVGDTSPTGILNNLNITMQHVKEFVLDGLANALMKQLAQQITNSIVNWINSGFDGSPSFVQNPSGFFLDVADQVTGDFIKNYDKGGLLGELCSPFSIDLRVALSFKYHPSYQRRYTCTLGTVIQNTKNAVKNASINGFTAGDFKQGGWPAFVSMTTEPQNNIYGAYLSADYDISLAVLNRQSEKKDQIAQGRGFLSWEKCVDNPIVVPQGSTQASFYSSDLYQSTQVGNLSYTGVPTSFNSLSYDGTQPVVPAGLAGSSAALVNQQVKQNAGKKTCTVETPGSVIAGSLDAHLSGPLRQLELANKINEIVNALFAQLASMVLQKGLGEISGSGPGDRNSYINQVQQSITTDNENLNSIKSNLVRNIDRYISNSLNYKTYKDSSLNYILEIKKKYDEAKACFLAKPNSLQNADNLQRAAALADIESGLLRITPIATRLLAEAKVADDRYNSLLTIKNNANATTTINGVDQNANAFINLVQGGEGLLTDQDIADVKKENEDILNSYRVYEYQAVRLLQQCTLQN